MVNEMKMSRPEEVSPCCRTSLEKRYSKTALNNFYCKKCGNFVPLSKIRFIIQESLEQWIGE